MQFTKQNLIGRERELNLLNTLFSKKAASLVVCRGRRRIGKSRLIQEFGSKVKTFFEFQGLAPVKNISNKEQLTEFSIQLSKQTGLPQMNFDNWSQAFTLLAREIKNEKTVILLDEISWMAAKDKTFAGKLKIAWDTEFKKHNKLILVLCGSVTSWIDENILNSTNYVGRISLNIKLDELPLSCCNQFWRSNNDRITSMEKIKLLAVTGGVPRYLEEIDINSSAEENIKRMCFNKEGFLFLEFDNIFNDIFSKKAPTYKELVFALVHGPKTLSEIALLLSTSKGGHLSDYLNNLVASGFIKQEFVYIPGRKSKSRSSKFRISDNYLRFYLKYIEPVKEKIESGLYNFSSLENLVEWNVILGYQFECIVLNNFQTIIKLLGVNPGNVQSASPYFQKKSQRKKACQIDLLIETNYSIYVCEIKRKNQITHDVIDEVKEKIQRLKIDSKKYSIRPVLIYAGTLSPSVENEGFFDKTIDFSELLNMVF